MRSLLLLAALSAAMEAAPRRILYVTHSAGFRHGSIEVSRRVLEQIAARSGMLEVVATEDLSLLSAENLRGFDAVFFFTSGELALSVQQKTDLLEFVRGGKAFGGAHSATDTLYNWPEYGDLIGGYFDGHPWTQEVAIDIEDPEHPATRGFPNSFRILEEIYQHRSFSRERVRVLMTLDTRSVSLAAPGINRTDGDFALAWVRPYGSGRVFYTALGHFDETWLDPRVQNMLLGALLWLTGEAPGDAAPRGAATSPAPAITPGGIVNAASFQTGAAPGALMSIFGDRLTTGSTMAAAGFPLPARLAGTSVLLDGRPVPLLFASPRQINAQLPYSLAAGASPRVVVQSGLAAGSPVSLPIETAAPGILAIDGAARQAMVIYCTGLGDVQPSIQAGEAAPLSPLSRSVVAPTVTIGGVRAEVFFSGLTPGFAGLYQVNAVVPPGLPAGSTPVQIEAGGRRSNTVSFLLAQ